MVSRHREVFIAAVISLFLAGCNRLPEERPNFRNAPLSLAGLLAQGETSGYDSAIEPRTFSFPDDHAAHPDFRNEWWYLTGNLTGADGHHFGYQFTLFRSAIAPDETTRSSDWATRQLYMAHLALTDVDGKTFYASERFSRGALGLAGVTAEPFRAWLDDWELTGEDPPPLRLRASTDTVDLEFEISNAKPVVLQGDKGLSRKGRNPGNASYYYSFTRMPTRGTIVKGLQTYRVQGSSWLDHEWSTSALEPSQIGWDWFALQLSDGRDLMIYNLRRDNDTADPLSSGTLVSIDGQSRALAASDFLIEPTDWWTSPATRIRYPGRWRLSVPSAQIELDVTPRLPDQELSLSILYWEGAVRAEGSSAGEAVIGEGYVELTGY